jgi:hypothetical protein
MKSTALSFVTVNLDLLHLIDILFFNCFAIEYDKSKIWEHSVVNSIISKANTMQKYK